MVLTMIPPRGIIRYTSRGYHRKSIDVSTTTISVQGMSCGHCVAAVTNEVTKIDGVTGVEVELASGSVEISSSDPIDLATVAAAIEQAGYEVTP